jgi:hypothetical protein
MIYLNEKLNETLLAFLNNFLNHGKESCAKRLHRVEHFHR